jgi:excisionase family DNA binding protein
VPAAVFACSSFDLRPAFVLHSCGCQIATEATSSRSAASHKCESNLQEGTAALRKKNKPTPDDNDELLTVDEVAEIFKVPVGTIRKWRTERTGPEGFRVGKYLRFRRSAVERFIAEKERDQH